MARVWQSSKRKEKYLGIFIIYNVDVLTSTTVHVGIIFLVPTLTLRGMASRRTGSGTYGTKRPTLLLLRRRRVTIVFNVYL